MTTEQATRWGIIDDTSIEEARELLHVPLRRDRMQWVEVATRDAVRQFAQGVGDDNPLWADADYANSTRWQGLLAPPSFLYAVDATIVAPKLPGVQWIYAGTRWQWLDAIRVNDAFDVSAQLIAMEEKTGRRFGRWVLQTGEIEYRNQHGVLLSVAQGRVARTPRQRGADAKSKSASTIAKPEAAEPSPLPPVQRIARRGVQPRLWESVQTGDTVGPDMRPLTLVDIYRWYVGAQGALHYGGAHADAVRYRHRHDDFEINAETGAKDSAARGHFSSKAGRSVGMGGAYDVGLHRISWMIAMLTDWCGDDGFLAELNVDVLRPNLVGDVTTLAGHVSHCWVADNAYVRMQLEARNQHDVVTARGHAVVALPSRKHGAVGLPLFAGDPAGFAAFSEFSERS
jgi:acyl dehydratase